MRACLVVYFSRTGMTRKAAEEIAAACRCKLEPILEKTDRSGLKGYIFSGYQAVMKKLPEINPSSEDPGDYETLILGTPVWASSVSAPTRSYIAQNAGHFNKIAVFCTMMRSGGDKALDEIEALAGKTPVARLVLTDAEIVKNSIREKVRAFSRRVLVEQD
ncbi:MAG TPA: flavodoxin [Noviherbaspirillum sp.]|nr:flavodoxin [Noviherbaspirillum sp.]